jgi:hypothetical protein
MTKEKKDVLARLGFIANEIGRLMQEQKQLEAERDRLDMQERLHR